MNNEELLKSVLFAEIEQAEDILIALKAKNKSDYNWCIDNLKLHFCLSKDILLINKLALLFSSLKIHSATPLLVSKLFDRILLKNGGTIIYALDGLKKSSYKKVLEMLKNEDLSYEMKEMLKLLKY